MPDVASAGPVADQPAADPEADDGAPAAHEPYDKPLIRFAVEAAGGFVTFPRSDTTGMSLSAHARIGSQLSEMFSIVYQGGIGFVHLTFNGEQGDDWDGGVIQGSALATLTLGGVFDIGAGPALDLYIWAGHWGSGTFSEPSFAPGAHARAAFHFPGWKSRRPNFVLGWDARAAAHPTHYESDFTPVVVGELTAGAEWH